MGAALAKPVPVATADSVDFWRFAADGQLMLRQCNACGNRMFYPRIVCARCLSTDLGWAAASGRGRVYAVTTIHRAPDEIFRADVPYTLAIVELDEGARMMCNIVDCSPERVAIDMPVEVVFEKRGETAAIPQFRPIAALEHS